MQRNSVELPLPQQVAQVVATRAAEILPEDLLQEFRDGVEEFVQQTMRDWPVFERTMKGVDLTQFVERRIQSWPEKILKPRAYPRYKELMEQLGVEPSRVVPYSLFAQSAAERIPGQYPYQNFVDLEKKGIKVGSWVQSRRVNNGRPVCVRAINHQCRLQFEGKQYKLQLFSPRHFTIAEGP